VTLAYRPLDLSAVTTRSIEQRAHQVQIDHFAAPPHAGETFSKFVEGLPRILKGNELHEVVDALAMAVRERKPIILGLGAHVVKCGLSPVIIDLIQRDIVSAVALNGGGAIHDVELALWGATSEDVEAGLRNGRYGMVAETGSAMQEAVDQVAALPEEESWGLGWALGRWLHQVGARYGRFSILQAAFEAGIPATVHVAIGTDTVHMLPGVDAGSMGSLSHRDFRLLASVIAELQDGGAYLNIGSAVVLPEVFLKCVTLCRNLGYPIGGFTTVDVDMVGHYRPATNVVARHRVLGARGYAFTGHHELMVPLLAFALLDRLASEAAVPHATVNGHRERDDG
jgi:hypothetical protein